MCGVLVGLLTNKETTWADKLAELAPELEVFMDLEGFKAHRGPKLLLVHYELLSKYIDKLVKYKKLNLIVVDEAHRLSSRGSKLSKAVTRLSWIKKKLILTGTPIESQPSDMFAQFRFLKPEVFGTRWEDFEKEYMEFDKIDLRPYKPGTELWQRAILRQRILRSKATFNPNKREKFSSLIAPYCFRIEASESGIKTAEVHKVVVPLLGDQRGCYEAMDKKQVITTPQGLSVVSDRVVTTIMKTRQLASGFIYDEDGELEYIGGAKERRLYQLFDKLRKPVVVFTAFKPDTDRIYQGLIDRGYDVARVYGKTKKKDRPGIWRAFQKGQLDGIVCQIRTGGVGVDLWKANNAIVHSMGHSYIDWDQAKARLNSRDKNKPPQFWVLCAEDTVDEDIFELVLVKHYNGKAVLDQLKKRRGPHGQSSRKTQSRRSR